MDLYSAGVWMPRDSSNAGLHTLAYRNAGGSSCSTDMLSRVEEGNRFVLSYYQNWD